MLESIGVAAAEQHVVPLVELESIWLTYLARLSERSEAAQRWLVADIDAVRLRLDGIVEAIGDLRVVWFALVNSEPVGIEAPAAPLLRAGLEGFVTRGSDLMLATRDGESGICLECNQLAEGDEYELVAWGLLAGG